MFNYRLRESEQLEYIPIGSFADLPAGERLFVEIDGLPIVVFNIAGELFAIADLCSHDNGPLGDGEVEGHQVICPRHGARFDVTDGRVLSLPAVEDIPAYPVRVREGEIEIGLPFE